MNMRMILIIAAMALATEALAQESPTEELVNPWYYCVGRVAGRQSDVRRNPEAAVERGFDGCRTEEAAVRSWGEDRGLDQATVNSVMNSHRSRLKAHLVAGIIEADRASKKRSKAQ